MQQALSVSCYSMLLVAVWAWQTACLPTFPFWPWHGVHTFGNVLLLLQETRLPFETTETQVRGVAA